MPCNRPPHRPVRHTRARSLHCLLTLCIVSGSAYWFKVPPHETAPLEFSTCDAFGVAADLFVVRGCGAGAELIGCSDGAGAAARALTSQALSPADDEWPWCPKLAKSGMCPSSLGSALQVASIASSTAPVDFEAEVAEVCAISCRKA